MNTDKNLRYSLCLILIFVICQLVNADCTDEEYIEWSSYGHFQTCRSQHIKQALQENVGCKPTPTVVKLPLPNNTDIQQMTPTFVEVLQCSGSCHRGNQDCVAMKTKEKKIPVMLAKCGITTGKCEKECATISVLEHVECGCDCNHIQKQSCPMGSHTYNTDTCMCSCSDTQSKQQCLNQGKTWSEDSCSCQCADQQPLSCSLGLVWSNITCSCVPEESILNPFMKDERLPRSETVLKTFLSWQIITIMVLLILVFILIVTIFALISKLHSAKRRLKTAKMQASARNSNNCSNDDNSHLYELYNKHQQSNAQSKDIIVKTKQGNNPEKFYSEIYCDSQNPNNGVSTQGGPGTSPGAGVVSVASHGHVYCESPSSGFGSEASKYSTNDLHADTTGPMIGSSLSPGMESIYHSAQTVRLNKKLQNISPPSPHLAGCSSPQMQHQFVYNTLKPQQGQHMSLGNNGSSMMPSDPIDEAVRLLEHSAAMLQ